MVEIKSFVEELKKHEIDFFTGVPDSLLKSLCAYLQDEEANNNIIAANEGAAMGIATGHHLATGKTGCVYMQNSGLGNTVNPLLSLVDEEVYHVPTLLIIGWRGEPGVHDEPQHIKQGYLTLPLLERMNIPYDILPEENQQALMMTQRVCENIKETNLTRAIVVRKGTFAPYSLKNKTADLSQMPREKAIETVLSNIPTSSVIVSTTGMISRELYELREKRGETHEKDFLTVGSMGHASQISFGIARSYPGKVFCFDGDGAAIMHLGSLAIIGSQKPENFIHIVFNNGAHDSVGGQPTVADKIKFSAIAKDLGYRHVYEAKDTDSVREVVEEAMTKTGPVLIEVRVMKGARKDLGRPKTTPVQNKESFMYYLANHK